VETDKVKAFCNDLASKQWAKVGEFLTDLLDKTPREELDSVDLGGVAPLAIWVDALLFTGLYKDSSKGRYLFLKLVREIWAKADACERWTMLCCVACLYGKRPGDVASPQANMSFFRDLAAMLGIPWEEMLHVVMSRHSQKRFLNERHSMLQ